MSNLTALSALACSYPGWRISTHWIARTAGPDCTIYRARRGAVTVSAYEISDLSRAMLQTAGEPSEVADAEILACEVLNEFPGAAYVIRTTLAAYRSGYLTAAEATEDIERAAQIERMKAQTS